MRLRPSLICLDLLTPGLDVLPAWNNGVTSTAPKPKVAALTSGYSHSLRSAFLILHQTILAQMQLRSQLSGVMDDSFGSRLSCENVTLRQLSASVSEGDITAMQDWMVRDNSPCRPVSSCVVVVLPARAGVAYWSP